MKHRKKILMWGCLLMACLSMACLLTACRQGNGGRNEMASTMAVSAKTPEATQESARETGTEQEMTTVMETSQTIPETMPETGSMAETDKAGENSETDQGEFTWLDHALAEGLGKEPGELTEEDYRSVVYLGVHGGDIKDPMFSQNDVVTFVVNGKENAFVVPFENFRHEVIDMRDIVKCGNLKRMEIVLNYTPRPEVYIIHYDELKQLQQLEILDIWLNWSTPFSPDIADKIDDLFFVCDMPNLMRISLKNIDLPDDLSPFFSHHFEGVSLWGCNVTENDFADLGEDVFYPRLLGLLYNQIKDATIITAMQTRLLTDPRNAVRHLGLGYNPIEELGDCLTEEQLSDYEDLALGLEGTDFAEYSFDWFTD